MGERSWKIITPKREMNPEKVRLRLLISFNNSKNSIHGLLYYNNCYPLLCLLDKYYKLISSYLMSTNNKILEI